MARPPWHAELHRFLSTTGLHSSDRAAIRTSQSDWVVATDALEEAGLIVIAQRLRSIIDHIISLQAFPDVTGYGPYVLHGAAHEAAEELGAPGTPGFVPPVLSGNITWDESEPLLDVSAFRRGYPALRLREMTRKRAATAPPATFRTFEAIYRGRRFVGRIRNGPYDAPHTWIRLFQPSGGSSLPAGGGSRG